MANMMIAQNKTMACHCASLHLATSVTNSRLLKLHFATGECHLTLSEILMREQGMQRRLQARNESC